MFTAKKVLNEQEAIEKIYTIKKREQSQGKYIDGYVMFPKVLIGKNIKITIVDNIENIIEESTTNENKDLATPVITPVTESTLLVEDGKQTKNNKNNIIDIPYNDTTDTNIVDDTTIKNGTSDFIITDANTTACNNNTKTKIADEEPLIKLPDTPITEETLPEILKQLTITREKFLEILGLTEEEFQNELEKSK